MHTIQWGKQKQRIANLQTFNYNEWKKCQNSFLPEWKNLWVSISLNKCFEWKWKNKRRGGWSFWEISASDCKAQKSIAKMRLIIHHPYSFSISVTSFHSLPLIRHFFFLSVYLFHSVSFFIDFFLFLFFMFSTPQLIFLQITFCSF